MHIFAPNGDYCLFIIWQGGLEVNPSVLIGSSLVWISPYGQFSCLFFHFRGKYVVTVNIFYGNSEILCLLVCRVCTI